MLSVPFLVILMHFFAVKIFTSAYTEKKQAEPKRSCKFTNGWAKLLPSSQCPLWLYSCISLWLKYLPQRTGRNSTKSTPNEKGSLVQGSIHESPAILSVAFVVILMHFFVVKIFTTEYTEKKH